MNDVGLFEVLPPAELSEEEFLAQAEGQIRGYGKLVVSGIVGIGYKLIEVKGRVGWKGYVEFVTERLGWSETHGDNFRHVGEMFMRTPKFGVEDADNLTIDASSLYLIAAPSTPAEVREKVLEQASTPEGISRADVEKLVAEARDEADAAARAEYNGKLVLTDGELARAAGIDVKRISEALTVYQHARSLVPQVMSNAIRLDNAFRQADGIKKAKEWADKGLELLREKAPKLAVRVDAGGAGQSRRNH